MCTADDVAHLVRPWWGSPGPTIWFIIRSVCAVGPQCTQGHACQPWGFGGCRRHCRHRPVTVPPWGYVAATTVSVVTHLHSTSRPHHRGCHWSRCKCNACPKLSRWLRSGAAVGGSPCDTTITIANDAVVATTLRFVPVTNPVVTVLPDLTNTCCHPYDANHHHRTSTYGTCLWV